MVKNLKLFRSITALALAGGLTLTSAPMAYAHNSYDNNHKRPTFEQLQNQNNSYCYIDTNNVVHKGKPAPGTQVVATFENFGYNMILNGQKIIYGTEDVSDSMVHLYKGLNKDFGSDVMYKTYTEKNGIANLLTKLLADGFTPTDAMNFVGYIDSHIYTGYGEDNFWYQSIKGNVIDDGNNPVIPKTPTYKDLQKYGDSHCYITNNNIVYKGVPAPGTSNQAVLQNFGDNLISNGRKIIYNKEKLTDSMYHLYNQLIEDFGYDVMYNTYIEKDGITNLLTKLISKGYSAIDAITFISYIDSNVYSGVGKDDFWYQGLEKESKKLFGDKNVYLPNMPSYKELLNYGDSNCYVTNNNIVCKGIPAPGTNNFAILQNFGDDIISNGRKILYKKENVSASMYYLYNQLNEDFGYDVMYKTYIEKDGISNLLAELINQGYSVIDSIDYINYINSNVYDGTGKDDFWYLSINDVNNYMYNKNYQKQYNR